MPTPKIYADFHNANSSGRLRLNCIGTMEDLAKYQLELRDGLVLTLYSDDLDDEGQLDELVVEGTVSFSPEEHCWVAAIDWTAIRNASKQKETSLRNNGLPLPAPPTNPAQTKV